MRKIYLFLFLVMVFAGFTARSQCSTIQPLTLATSTSVTLSGSGNWVLGGCNQNAFGQEQIYQFTAPVAGTYMLNILSASGGYIDYYYKPVSGGCSPSGWTCIIDVNGISSIPIGTLTAGTQYYILADAEGTTSRTHSFSVTAVSTLTTVGNLSPFTTCESSLSDEQSFTIEGTGLTSNINIAAPLGFLVSLNNSSYVPSLSLAPSSGIVTTTTIYVRLTGATAPGSISGNISCTATGATTQTIPVSGTVNPRPDVNPITNQTVCRNSTTTAVNFTGSVPGTVYNWSNSNTAIGLAANGSGNIASFTATNNTSAPITSTVTATPAFGTAIPEILYYKFDGSGPTAPNLASNPPAGTAVGSFNGNAFQGNGSVCNGSLQTTSTNSTSSDYFVTGWNASLNNTSWTLSFIASGFPSSGGAFFVMGSQITTPFQVSYSIINGGFNFSLDGSNPISMHLTGTTGPSTKTITIVYDDIIKEVRAYVNGTLSASQSATLNQGNLNFSGFNIGDIVGGFLGIRGSSSIDEVRMYSRALSVVEIQALVNSCDGGGVCTGSPETFDITVYPDLVVNDPTDQTICDGSATTAVNFTGTAGAIYNWTNNNPSIGLAANGTGNIPSFIPTFSGISPITAEITVTPSFSGGPACTSSSQTFTITVNPIPNVNNVASQTVCNNAATSSINFSGSVQGTNYTWTNSNPSIGLSASGSGSIPSFTAINATGTFVTSTITVTPTFGSCTGSPEIFGITVNPSPIVNPVSSQNVCTGSNTTAINFTGNVAGATYNWTNSNPSIGLAASGTGNIASFTAINTGTITEIATITVTPVDPNSSCPGATESFTILVSPVPTGTATPASQTVCSESAISTIAFTGNVPGITFDWARDNLATVTGIPGVGNGNISGTLTNTTNAPVTVMFTVTPSLGGCVGTPFTVTVIVNENLPVATATPTSQTICSGSITPIVLSSNYAGATYSWTRNNTAAVTGIAASGSGDITGTLFNTTTTPITVTFTIIPTFNGCDGAPITATVLVNAVPTIICPANIVANNTTGVCGTTVNYNTIVTGAPAPTLSYTLSGATIGNGNGNGSGTLFNVGVTTVTVTASNVCGTAFCSFTVMVNDTENPTITCPANIQANTDAGICAGTVATPNPIRADNCAVTELTWTLTGATTGSSPATGINNVGTRLFNKGVTTVTYTVKDAAGNSATCSYTVTVRDLENPVITCSPNITKTTQAGLCVAEVTYTVTATDNCPGVTTQLVSGPASGSAFPLGTTTITWRAIDAATNLSTNCSFTVTVLDGQLPVISAQPTTRTVCAGTSTTFSVTAATAPNAGRPIAYQWQQWSGLAWNNIAGATSSTYTISNPTVAMNTNTFRVVLTGLCTVVNSNAATLYVNALPTITLSAATYSSIIPGQQTTLTANVNPTSGSFAWWFNNNPLTGGNTSAVVSNITVDEGIGTYYTIYTDQNGCVVKSADYIISGQPTNNMWVYPNPNNGFFQVRYYNQINEEATVMVFNATGQLMYQRALTTRLAYSAIVVDMTNRSYTSGVYIVKVVSRTGRELAAKRVVIYR